MLFSVPRRLFWKNPRINFRYRSGLPFSACAESLRRSTHSRISEDLPVASKAFILLPIFSLADPCVNKYVFVLLRSPAECVRFWRGKETIRMERKQRTGPGERRNPGKGRPGLDGMRILVRLGILALLGCAGHGGIEAAMPELQELGTWRPIWRYQPVISEWAHVNQGLIEIPEYMLDTPIAYERRRDAAGNPYSMEVPFADHLSVVRLLGGWNANPNIPFGGSAEADLAYRDNSGEVTYRWDLLEERLRPYVVESGYRSLTLVMDNVPSGIARNPVWRNFGQASCPADFDEWEAFMRGLAEQLVGLYGYDVARYFRFRVGTETHSTGRFQGSQEDYFRHYNHTSAGIRSVLPEAEIGPGNLFFKFPDIRDDNVDYFALAEHVNTGSNHATGGIGDSYDFLGASYYYTKDSPQTPQARGIKPSVADSDEFWDLSAQLAGRAAPFGGRSRNSASLPPRGRRRTAMNRVILGVP